MTILKSLIKRQETLSYLYSPTNMEVYTPAKLVKEMLDKLPNEVWSNSKLKFCDPTVKSGAYLSEIVIRLMEGLQKFERNENKRYIYIIENMIHGYTTSDLSYRIVKKLLLLENSKIMHSIFNYSFLEEKNNMKFDVIVGNPPYNNEKNINGNAITKGKGNSILWDKFVLKSLDFLKESGYLCLVHPALWRKPEYYLWDVMSKKQITYLEIHNTQDGLKTFSMSTRYDWYILQNKEYKEKTEVIDENGKKYIIDLRKCKFLPNFDYKKVEKYLAKGDEDKCEVIYGSSAYHTQKNHINKEKTKEFKYPVVYKIYKNGSINFMYSSINTNGHFNIPKIIISKEVGGSKKISPPINDFKGEYSAAEFCFLIPIKNKKDGDLLIKFLISDKFNEMAYMWNTVELDYRIFKYFKKDFWKIN